MENTKRPNSYEQLERLWLDRGDADDRPDWRLARAVLMLAAEVRDAATLADENARDILHELESIKARMPE